MFDDVRHGADPERVYAEAVAPRLAGGLIAPALSWTADRERGAVEASDRLDAPVHPAGGPRRGVITHGGDAPNVVPDRAEAEVYVREATSAALDALLGRVYAAAEGSATATGTTVEVTQRPRPATASATTTW